MTTRRKERKKLTAKFCDNVREEDEYLDYGGPVQGLIFIVGRNEKRKSWLLRYRYHRKRREMGLGSYPKVTLADAREKGGDARKLLAQDIDPIEHRKKQKRQSWLADAKNLTFLAVAEKFFDIKTRGDDPWWTGSTPEGQRRILNGLLKPLHDYPINNAEAAESITLRLYNDIVGPIWQNKPAMARHTKSLAFNICDHAIGLKILPADVANPAGKPLDILLADRQPNGGHWPDLPYQKLPPLMAKLDDLCQPRIFFTIGEAARAVGMVYETIYKAILDGRVKATKGERPIFRGAYQEWRIEPADLFNVWEKKVDVIPGLPSVTIQLIKFSILTAVRPGEARMMTKFEYDPIEQIWTIPWQRTKEGRKIRKDHSIPLSPPAAAIVEALLAQIERDEIETDYVFCNYLTANKRSALIGKPVCNTTVLNRLRTILPPEEMHATMHGMRTAFRSWGEDQRTPDGYPRFTEKDLERATGQIKGFGETEVSRRYSRQSKGIIPLIPIFNSWADFLFGRLSADVIPIRRKAIGG
jgi:Arm DNA-binding domain